MFGKMSVRSSFFGLSMMAASSVLAVLAAGCAADASGQEPESDAQEIGTVQRPPQFVILAFDGSLNNGFWEESRAFARDANVKFTYFISGVYFIPDAKKSLYDAPHGLGPGKSAIGFGGDASAIALRYKHLQKARDEGHEIGSHANGHFDGSSWTEADWKSEFDQFDKIIFQGAGVPNPNLSFGPTDAVGFRAPQLGHSPGLYTVLKNHNYAYDTSKSGPSNYWPQQNNGVWNFPLAELRIVGSNKRTLSMDYNFYVADSRGEADAANRSTYEKQMVDTYVQYFESNYFGNRGPIHIGHHFSKWNGGAYWAAMQTFAQRVCGLPEVKCVTYKDLLAFVTENKEKIPAYQAGSFTRMARPPSSEAVDVSAPFTDEERAEALQAHESHDDEAAEE
jgi:hypothetical protein